MIRFGNEMNVTTGSINTPPRQAVIESGPLPSEPGGDTFVQPPVNINGGSDRAPLGL